MMLTNLGDIAVQRSDENERTAVVQLDGIKVVRDVTYSRLARLTGGAARWLTDRKLSRGARVMIVGDNSIDYMTLF